MAPPRIIALVGIDGAGKSTHARWLADWLTAHGTPARYSQNPGGRLRLGRIAQRLGRPDAAALFGTRGFAVIEALIRWAAIARGLLLARLTGSVAVMDRYSYCQYVAAHARGTGGERWLRALYAPFPRPDLVFLLAVPPEQAQQRIALRGRDSEELAHLQASDAAYRQLPEAAWFTVVDAGAEPPAVQAALAAALTGPVPVG